SSLGRSTTRSRSDPPPVAGHSATNPGRDSETPVSTRWPARSRWNALRNHPTTPKGGPTVDIEQLREAHKKNLAEREQKQKALDEARAAMKKVTDGAEARGDGALSADEVKAHTEARDKATALVAEIKALDEARAETEQRIDDWEASEAARAAAEESAKRYGGTERVERVNEPDLYRKGGEHSFFSDIYRMRYDADPMATERIMRHQRVHDSEARAVGTSAFAGLVVPQYLTEDYAAVAREGRPLADFIGARPLPPEGMTLNVPRGDTGTLVNS